MPVAFACVSSSEDPASFLIIRVSILFSWSLISCLFYFLNLGKTGRLEGIEGRWSSLLSADI